MKSLFRNGFILIISAAAFLSACRTHDRVMYSIRPVKHLRPGPHALAAASPTPTTTVAIPETTVISAPEATPGMPSVPAPALPGSAQ